MTVSSTTKSRSSKSRQYVDFDEFIDYQLQRARRGIRSTDVITACVGVGVILLGYIVLFTVLDHWVIDGGFGRTARMSLVVLLGIVSAAWLVRRLAAPLSGSVTDLYAAKTIEKSEPGLRSLLLSLVDLTRSRRRVNSSVRSALEKQAAVRLSRVAVEDTVDRRELMQFMWILLGLVVACCVYAVISPRGLSFVRPLTFFDAAVATQTRIDDVRPGDSDLLAGSQLEVVADIRGEIPDAVSLHFTTDDQRFVDETIPMRRVDQGLRQFRGIITGENGRGLLQSLSYYVRAGDSTSDTYRVTILEPPSANVLEVRYTFPDYMRFAPRTQPGGHIDTWEGAQISIRAETNMPVRSAVLRFLDRPDLTQKAEESRMTITDGTRLEAAWTAKARGDGSWPAHYYIHCLNDQHETDPDPSIYNVNVRRDQPPVVNLLDPIRGIELPENGDLSVMVRAEDPDFMLESVSLAVRPGESDTTDRHVMYSSSEDGERAGFSSQRAFSVRNTLQLSEGDLAEIWIEAVDNKTPFGNTSRTRRITLKITEPASREELRRQQEADEQHKQQIRHEQSENSQRNRDPAEDDDRNTEEPPGHDQNPSDEADSDERQSDESGEGGEQGRATRREDSMEPDDDSDPTGVGDATGEPGEKKDDDEALQELIRRMQQEGEIPEDDDAPPQGELPPNEQQETSTGQERGSDGELNGSGENNDARRPESLSPAESDPVDGDPAGETDSPTDNSEMESMSEVDPVGSSQSDDADQSGNNEPNQSTDAESSGATDDSMPPDPATSTSNDDNAAESSPDETSASDESAAHEKTRPQSNSSDAEQPENASSARSRDEAEDGERSGNKPSTSNPGDRTGQEPNADDSSESRQSDRRQSRNGTREDQPANRQDTRSRSERAPERRRTPDANRDGRVSDVVEDPEAADNPSDPPRPPADRPPRNDARRDDSPPPDPGDREPPADVPGGARTSENDGAPSALQEDNMDSGETSESDGSSGTPQTSQDGSGDPESAQQSPAGASAPQQSTEEGSPENSGSSKSDEKSDSEDAQSESESRSGAEDGDGSGTASDATGASPLPGDSGSSRSGTSAGGRAGSAPTQPPGPPPEGGGGMSPSSVEPGDEAHLEDARKAADLVLTRLHRELKRGEVDRQLLEDLGWTEADLRRFAQRLRNNLQADRQPSDDSPESLARRKQFEEMLRSMNLKSRGTFRRGRSDRDDTIDGTGPRQSQPPPEYRETFRAYKRSLSRNRARPGDSSQ